MTAKEKAIELMEKCKDELIECDAYFLEIGSKNMALITVNEILKVLFRIDKKEIEYNYWLSVKQEIENI